MGSKKFDQIKEEMLHQTQNQPPSVIISYPGPKSIKKKNTHAKAFLCFVAFNQILILKRIPIFIVHQADLPQLLHHKIIQSEPASSKGPVGD